MARRSDINWAAVENEYRIGQLSVSLIADVYGVSRRSIQRRAAQHAWRYGELLPLVNARIAEELALFDRDLERLIESTVSLLGMFERLNENNVAPSTRARESAPSQQC